MTRPLYVHAGIVDARYLPPNLLASQFIIFIAVFVAVCGQINDVTALVHWITRRHGFVDVSSWNIYSTSRDPSFDLHDRSLHVWPKARYMSNPFFVLSLEFLNKGARIVVGPIIDKFMARCTEQNQIVGRVDVVWPRAIHSARTKLAKRDDVCVFRKIATLKC